MCVIHLQITVYFLIYYTLSRIPSTKHHRVFLPGYHLHQCLEVTTTYNGLPNFDGFTEEYLFTKIDSFKRLCWKVGEQVKMVNSELYSMHLPKDSGMAWQLILTIFSICTKLCRKYTNFNTEAPERMELTCTLEYVQEIKCMLAHLKYCSLYNPLENITAKSLNLMSRLMRKSADAMDSFLKYVEATHRTVR